MTKAEIVEDIANKTGLTKKDVAMAMDQFLESISKALADGKHYEIRGFGTFKVKARKARMARNPRTGEAVPVPDRKVPVRKFKIQFARMGEPAYNRHVLEVLEELPGRFDAPGLWPTVSTIAPRGSESFFDGLLDIKEELYRERFQMQFSIHTTDVRLRDWLIPVPKWDLARIAGTSARAIKLKIEDKIPKTADGKEIFLGRTIHANLTGRPDIVVKQNLHQKTAPAN